MQRSRNMTTIFKFAYIMIICVFLLNIAAQEIENGIHPCKKNEDCNHMCVMPGLPWCHENNLCFCYENAYGNTR
ncbi:Nodule Cysteine-Rich (NCR) secreted peptide [Medicago truncatula]|uniref:Nodule Cysteine-Rich (NCR) secreted peptide n=2 Tax=Medicago truncatula TaxID=3880 RepID=A7KHE0_MEDTR|nr:nodule-specific cysteine-rich peptide 309 [Medicago truncatula]AES87298.2 Nodule Cysteine-Rich (NCR) secreted peptide [Medicago truncatula]